MLIDKNIEEIQQEFVLALSKIGFTYTPYNTDLLEVITHLANELDRTKAELWNLKIEMYNKISNIEKEINK